MFDNVIDIVNSSIKGKKVEFKSKIDKNIPDVLLGDQARIEQILLSVLNNAIRYTDKGCISFDVDALRTNRHVRTEVRTCRHTGHHAVAARNQQNQRRAWGQG